MSILIENIWNELPDMGLGNDFFDDIKSTGNKSKNKREIMSDKKLLHSKEKINKMKSQPPEWEKIFAKHISDKGLISKMYKEIIQLNCKQQ